MCKNLHILYGGRNNCEKEDLLYRYRGVSSKYLNRNLALFTALEQAGYSVFHPELDSIRQLIACVNAVKHIRSLYKEGIWAI